MRHRPREARRLFVAQAPHERPVEQFGVGRAQRVEVAAHDGGTAVTPFVERLQEDFHLLRPVRGVGAVLQVGRCELHRDAVEADGGEHGDAATHPGLGRIGGEPPGARFGQPDDDRFAEVRRRHDGVAVEAPFVDAARRGALLRLVTQAELDELDAEHVARPDVGRDGVGDVLVVGAGHAVVELREQADGGAGGVEAGRQLHGAASALDVPGHDAQPARQVGGRAGVPPRDLVQAGELVQQPVVEIVVSDPGRPVGSFMRASARPRTEPATAAAPSSGLIGGPARVTPLPYRAAMASAPRTRARAARRRRLPLCRVHGDLAALGGALPRLRRVEHARPCAGAPRRSQRAPAEGPPALPLADVSTDAIHPLPTGVSELDRVMGGGVVAGSVTLLFGPPGIGKSTLLFQVLSSLAATGLDVMLASAEESLAQVRGRASRIGLVPRHLLALEGPDVEAIEAAVERHRPALVVVDSLQSVSDPELGQPAGSLAQVRACVERLTRMAKSSGVPLLLVGPRDQGRRPGRAPGRRAPGRHRPLLRRRPSPRPPRPDLGQAPLRADRGGRHLRDARRRPARRARPRPAAARRPHGRRARQRGGAGPAGPPARCSSRCRHCSGPAPAAAPGRRGRRPWASTRRGPTSSWPSWPAAPRSRSRRRPRCSPPPWAASRVTEPAADLAVALAMASVITDAPLPPDVVVFGELGPGRRGAHRPRRGPAPGRGPPGRVHAGARARLDGGRTRRGTARA